MALPVRRREPTTSRPPAAWEPFREFEELQRRTTELMESVWSGIGGGEDQPWIPSVDVEETDDAWIVEAELAGVKRDDVNVEIRDNELEISGEVKEREREGILRRRTRRVGFFDYRVALPGPVDAASVDAKLDDGVLTVRIPKPEQASARRVDVRSA
jgi:HSP20 family protein